MDSSCTLIGHGWTRVLCVWLVKLDDALNHVIIYYEWL
jgi:hypothetical protein